MIAIEDIQNTVYAALRAHDYLTDVPVLYDTGGEEPAAETALGDDGGGCCLVVSLPVNGEPTDSAKNIAIENVSICVAIRFNPTRNSANASNPKDIMKLLRCVREAVMGWAPENRGSRPFTNFGFESAGLWGEFSYYCIFKILAAYRLSA